MPRAANVWLWGWTITSFLMCIVVCLVIAVCLTYVMDFILTFINIRLMKPVLWLIMGFHMVVALGFLFLIVISNSCCRRGRCYKTCCCFHILSILFAHFLHFLWIILIIVMLLPALLFVGVHFACVYVPTCISVTDFGLQADLFEQYNIEGVLAAINNFNTSSLYGIADKLEKALVNYLDELEDSDWLDSLLSTVENSAVARMNSSTLFRQVDDATEFVFDKFDIAEDKVDLFATFLNFTVHAKTDDLLTYINDSLEMLDENVLDSDLLFRIINTSYAGHIEDVAAYIDDITDEKLTELETLLEKRNVSIPGSIGSLNLNKLLDLPQLANVSLPTGILESLPDSSRLDLLLEVMKTNASLSENPLAVLPESTQLNVLMELLKKNVSLPEESLASFSKVPSLEVIKNLLSRNASLPTDALTSLPQYARQGVLLHLLKNNMSLPDNAFASIQETARVDVFVDMLRNNLTLPKDALKSMPRSPKLDVLVRILSKNMSLPQNPLASVPEPARLDVLLYFVKNNVSLPEDPLPSLPSSARLKLLRHFLRSNVSVIPDSTLASFPEPQQKEILFLLIRNNISLSDEQFESLKELVPETTNLTVPELYAFGENYPMQNKNDTELVALELLRNASDDFPRDLLTFDIMQYANQNIGKAQHRRPPYTSDVFSSELDHMILDGDGEDLVNITREQKEQIMGKLRRMANEATVMAILASEEARAAMKKAVEAGKDVLEAVDENSRMLARLAKEKAHQAAEKAKAAARWSLNKARQGILKVKEVGTAMARRAWNIVHDLALNCRRYASAAFTGARLAVREARKSTKYVVQLADRALVYFRKGYAYVRNFCQQLGLRKRAVGVYCAEAKDYYCKKIEGSAIRLVIVFLTSIFLNIALVNYLISLSASVMAISYAKKIKKRRKIYAPAKGSLSLQMAETGSYTMLTNM